MTELSTNSSRPTYGSLTHNSHMIFYPSVISSGVVYATFCEILDLERFTLAEMTIQAFKFTQGHRKCAIRY